MIVLNQTFLRKLRKVMESLNYKVNDRPNEVNIVGIRKDDVTPNKFDDKLVIFWKNENGRLEGREYPITTDAGTYWLKNPMNVDGTALLKAGQWAYKIGSHRGYKALNQRGKVTVIRDYDRNAILDFNNGKEDTGYFGINIHRATSSGTSTLVDKWSAGCQVFANSNDFADFLELVQKSVDKYGNDSLYYTLIDERATNRKVKRWTTYALIGLGVLFLSYSGYKYIAGKPFIPKIKF